MVIEKINTENGIVIRLLADENMRITNAQREFYTTMIYIPNEDLIPTYEEVPRSVWKNFVDDEPIDYKEAIELIGERSGILEEEQKILKTSQSNINGSLVFLEETLLDTDFRLLQLGIGLDYQKTRV